MFSRTCRLWCAPGQELEDCCVDSLGVATSAIFSLLLFAASRCARCTQKHSRTSSGVLEWPRCLIILSVVLSHLIELAESSVALASLGHLSTSSLLAILTPLTSLILLLSAALVTSAPTSPISVRILLFAAWVSGAAARGARLRHLVGSRDLVVSEHARPATAAACTALYSLLAIIELIIIVLQRRRNAKGSDEKTTETPDIGYRHANASITSQATFWWLTPLLWRGSKKPLELEDLGRLPPEESTEHLFTDFKKIYDKEKITGGGSASLWHCYARSCGARFMLGGLYKLLGDLVGLAGPLGISIIIEYAARSSGVASLYPKLGEVFSNGYVMGCVVLVASLAQGTFSQASTHLVNVEGIRLKAALQALVYDKSLRLAVWSFGEGGGGSHGDLNKEETSPRHNDEHEHPHLQGTDAGVIANLMSEDAYNVMSCLWIGHYVWAIPLKIAVIMWLLYMKLGWSAVLGAAFCVLTMTPLQLLIGKRLSANSKLVSEASDERLRKINETMQGIKLIKLYSWEDEFCKRILGVREHELKLLDTDSLYWALMTFLTHASSALVTLVTFVAYMLLEKAPLTPGHVFSALALFNQLTVPLFIFPVTVPLIIGAVVSTKRLENFLSLPEISESTSPPPAPEPPIEKHQDNFHTEATPNHVGSSLRAESNDSVFGPAGLGNIHEDEEDEEEDDTHTSHVTRSQLITPITPAVTVTEDSGFAWSKDAEEASLHVTKKLMIPQGHLTLVVGSVGCGKTSLLSALLGEMQVMRGGVTWDSGASVAYVSQKPWLLNATLRDNILFGQAFRPRRYSRVVAACALQPDIAILPAGDLTHIGEKGIALSGGQRQRICVARALYSRASLLLLDDPLSALDAHVAQHVVESGVRRLLLRRQHRTVVLVTHRLQLLPLADHVVAMEAGKVRAQGLLSEIERRDPGLVAEWRAAMCRQAAAEEAHRGRGRTARERWQLVRLVSRFGVQLRHKPVAPDGTWQPGEEAHLPPSLFVPFRRRTFTSSLSRRHLSHDLPLPIDECGDDMLELAARSAPLGDTASMRLNRAFSGRRNVFRTVSLQTGGRRRSSRKGGSLPQLTRQMSTPSMPQNNSAAVVSRPRTFTVDGLNGVGRQGSFLRRLFSVTAQRSAPAAVHLDNTVPAAREKNVLRRLLSSSSTRSSISVDNERPPVRRLASSTSAFSDDFIEDDEAGDDEGGDETSCEDSARLAAEEEREYGKVARRVYLSYMRASGPLLGGAYLLSALAWQACRVMTDYWLSAWTESSGYNNTATQQQHQLKDDQMSATSYLLVYAGLSVFSILLSLGCNFLGQVAGARARRELHETALRAVLRSPMRFFEATPLGRVINRFAADMAVIDKKISISIQRLVQFLLLCVSAIVVNAVISPWFTLIAIPICLVYYWVQRFYRASARELQRLDSLTRSPIFSHFSETLGGLSTIRAFGQQDRFTRMLHTKMDSHRNAFLIINSGNRWLGIALDYLGGVIVFTAVLAALISARLLPHLVTPALVGLAVNYTLLVPIYLNWVVKFLSDMEMYMTAVERVEQYARLPSEDYREEQGSIPDSWPESGNISFEGVSLRYDREREPVISKLDLVIPAGQKVGICGRTGSGKSSLAMSLFCMVEAHEGRLLVDGKDVLKDVPLATLRSRLSAIPQDAIMFSGTLRDNLDPKHVFADDQLWSALELAQVRSTASALPGGLDGEVREGGENFSAGQRQLLCLARAALHGARCLVLDEATSSLDPATEQRLIAAAARAFNGRTVITIAHRLATLLTCDRIVVLSAGRIVEDASPAELLGRPASIFSEMLRASEEGSLL